MQDVLLTNVKFLSICIKSSINKRKRIYYSHIILYIRKSEAFILDIMTKEKTELTLLRAQKLFEDGADLPLARELLQQVFDRGFELIRVDPGAQCLLDGAYSLLRRIRTSSKPGRGNGKRYELYPFAQSVVFCADILSAGTKSLILNFSEADGFVSLPEDDFALALSGIIANAFSYSDSDCVEIGLFKRRKSFVFSVKSEGFFSPDSFLTPQFYGRSLDFAHRLLLSFGGRMLLVGEEGFGNVVLELPFAPVGLPVTAARTAEELLYDRLSPVYIAFCGH